MPHKKIVVIMVGLPARRKTFMSRRLARYLEWQGYRTRIFNVGEYRRERLGLGSSESGFFNPSVAEFTIERERIAKSCFNDLLTWMKTEGEIAIYDATNVTAARREYLAHACASERLDYIFVENICDDQSVLERLVALKISGSVDYIDKDLLFAKEDFLRRISHYERVYETVDRRSPHIKIYNLGERVLRGYASERSEVSALFEDMAEFLGAMNLSQKEIYLTRHGETVYNVEDRIGGDSSLTARGKEYAKRLSDYFSEKGIRPLIFISGKRRTAETAAFFDAERVVCEDLNEINSGTCDGLSYSAIALRHPEIHAGRNADKLNFRYPGGESYRDLILRVRGAVKKIESQRRDVLVIAHRAVNRCLYSYFVPVPLNEVPQLEMPLGRLMKIRQKGAGYECEDIPVA